jgi:MFS family permease
VSATPAAQRLAWLIGVPGLVYLLSQVLRNSVAVVERDLEADFGIGAAAVGSLSGALFLAYAAAQVPLGVAVDRLGPRRVLGLGAVLMVAGTLLFAVAQAPWELLAARILMGVGAGPVFAAIMSLVAGAVPAQRFAEYSGRVTGIGRTGVILAAAPLAALVALADWRGAFVTLAVLMGVSGFAMMRVLRGTRTTPVGAVGDWATVRSGLRQALVAPGIPRLIAFQTAVTGTAFTLLAGWGVPWLRSGGLSLAHASAAMTLCALAYALGALVWGGVPRWLGSERMPNLIGGAALALLLALPALGWLEPGGPAMWAWLAAFGLASAMYPLVLDRVRRRLPPELIVRGVTMLGVISIGGSGLLLAIAGTLIHHHGAMAATRTPEAFVSTFALLAVLVAVTTVALAFAPRAPAPSAGQG